MDEESLPLVCAAKDLDRASDGNRVNLRLGLLQGQYIFASRSF